ncbi:hypothetical protein [Streptomyces sp. NPDC005805]|uniref:hypothetical protein n=1 Tax=Streptomyces sp. NPDC005805 TaxID=3157068 RepID=UPI0033E98AD3
MSNGPEPEHERNGFDVDEDALRRLLQGAVDELKPAEGALDHLRRAVPARRARKRQALVGAAAAVLLAGTAVPALLHVTNSGGAADTNAVNAGHGEQAQGGTGNEPGATGGEKDPLKPPGDSAQDQERGEKSGSTRPGEEPDQSASDGASGAPRSRDVTGSGAVPRCQISQLGASATTNGPDAEGKVYGTFRVTNVSQSECSVTGGGSVGFQAAGAADPARISVVGHTSGGPAGGLPDPSAEVSSVLLKPSAAYEVKFAWIPSDTCPTTGPSPDPSPSDGTAAGGTGSTGGSTGETGTGGSADGTEAQLRTTDGVQPGSVTVTHSADAGAPSAQATVSNACAGTIYRTGILPAV